MASTEPIPADVPFEIKDYHSFWQACSELNPDALFLLAKILCDETVAQKYSHIIGQIKQDRCSAYYIAGLAYSFADEPKRTEINHFRNTEQELNGHGHGHGQCQSFSNLGIPLFLPEHSNTELNAKLIYRECKKDNESGKRPHFQQAGTPAQADEDVYFLADEDEDRSLSDDEKYLRAPGDEPLSFQTLSNFLDKARQFVIDNPKPFIVLGLVLAIGGMAVAISFAPIITPLAGVGLCFAIAAGCKLYRHGFFGKPSGEKKGSDATPPPRRFGLSYDYDRPD